MAKRPLGCISGVGFAAAMLVILLVAGVTLAQGGMLFSPGALNAAAGEPAPAGQVRSHAELAGRCAACHPAPWDADTMASRCLTCHTDIATQMQHANRMHAILLRGQRQLDCRPCHTEHHGAAGQLTVTLPADFPHTATGYALQAHRQTTNGRAFACNDCHTTGLAGFDQATCSECHTGIDVRFMTAHQAAYSVNCLACHDGIDRYGTAQVKFDHARTAFKLEGQHTALDCGKCHSGVRQPADFRRAPKDCAGCHLRDPHAGRLGHDCAACHTPANWEDAHVDHSRTAFPLLGKHAAVACQECHANDVFQGTPKDCASCHLKDDPHQGKLGNTCNACHAPDDWHKLTFDHSQSGFPLTGKHANAACKACHADQGFKGTPRDCAACHLRDDPHKGQLGAQCGACHSPSAWQPATFDHAASAFPLTGKHANAACKDCHADQVFKGTPRDCAACHLRDDPHKGQLGAQCGACHSPSAWQPATFDHAASAFPLTGKHANAACKDCHADQVFKGTPRDCAACHLKDDPHKGQLGAQCDACHSPSAWQPATFDHAASVFPLTGKHANAACKDCHADQVFKGTPRDCAACHLRDDPHKGQLGAQCGACHSPSAWQPATFDHAASGFPLTGKHASAACKDCHADQVFKGTPKDCAACHLSDDAHNGQFGTQCASCHSTAGWQPVTFDHNRSTFPLTGKHTSVACLACHKNNVFKGTSHDCAACHLQNDAHNGQFGTQCASCHSTAGWQPVTFDHNRSTFPLTGKHTSVACLACHKNNVFKGTSHDCAACHLQNDAHNGQFGTQCGTCHSTAGWLPAMFDHNRSTFPLTGKHTSVACLACHKNNVFKGTSHDCAACHLQNDAHNGQFGTQCGTCHSTAGWLPAMFDHNRSTFPLTGKHTSVACLACHKNNVFKGTPHDCAACHLQNDAHNGQFGTQCGSCHSTAGWQPATFDHNRSAFPLTGAHVGVLCSNCHVNRVFKGTPAACEGCHHEPAFHAGLFPTGCAACHNATAWRPATFNRPHPFPFNHGRAGACRDCHVTLNTYTCAGCHPDSRIVPRHQREGIVNIQDCVRCHPTGREND